MAKWNEYGLKTGTSARDEVLILDSDTNTNKRITVGDIQEFANGKMLEKENATLNTEAKTLIGAINEVDAKNDAQDASLEAIEKKFSGYVKKTDVDSTLLVSGSPADAKAVSDALKKEKSERQAEIDVERKRIDNVYSNKLVTLDEIDLVTEEGFFVDALAVKELNSKTKWKLFDTATGIKGINIKELVDSGKDIRAVVTAQYNTKGNTIKFVFDISPENVAGTYPDGYCFSPNNYATVAIVVGKSYDLFVQKSWWSMRESASTTIPINDETVKLEVYYR